MVDSWQSFIAEEQQQPYFQKLNAFLAQEKRADKVIFPPEADVFRAFELTPLSEVRVVLLGQDPYHGAGQAHGLCFSVKPGVPLPPSLKNIYKELADDIEGFQIPASGFLERWALQGVLMLNTVLTVEQGKAHSHAKAGWETFTDHVLNLLNQQRKPIIFVLWGGHAIKKGQLITAPQHRIISGPHPSPLSAYRGFFGCHHFSAINQQLQAWGQPAIDWQP
jgi:uracil-DNA glycosylase